MNKQYRTKKYNEDWRKGRILYTKDINDPEVRIYEKEINNYMRADIVSNQYIKDVDMVRITKENLRQISEDKILSFLNIYFPIELSKIILSWIKKDLL